MKKLLTFAASICAAALMFTGCPSVHSDLDPKIDLSTATICGSMEDWKGSALTDNGDGTWAYKFIARGDQENFALRGSNSWGVDYRSADGSTLLPEYKMDEEMELVPFNSPDCPPLKGLVKGDEYTITVVPGSTAVKMTIAHTGSKSDTLNIIKDGLISTMDFDGDKTYTAVITTTNANEKFAIYNATKGKSIVVEKVAVGADAVTATLGDAALIATDMAAKMEYKVTVVNDSEIKISIEPNVFQAWIKGGNSAWNGDVVLTNVSKYELSYEFVMPETTGWGEAAGKLAFKLLSKPGNWDSWIFADCEVPLNSGYHESGANKNNNGLFTGLTAGNTYVVSVKVEVKDDGSVETCKVKIEDKVATNYYVIGCISKGAFVKMDLDGATDKFAYTFKYDAASMTAWGGSLAGGVNFKVNNKDSWSGNTAYSANSTITIGTPAETVTAPDAGNTNIKLEDGKTYKVLFDATATTITVSEVE